MGKCPICQSQAEFRLNASGTDVSCERCGQFDISRLVEGLGSQLEVSQVANISGWIREHQGVRISEKESSFLRELRTPSVGEKADKLLLFLASLYPKPGFRFRYRLTKNPDCVLGACWAEDAEELSFLLADYLIREREFLTRDSDEVCCRISPKGWAHLYSLAHTNTGSTIGFVALRFHESINKASNTVESAISAAGYSPLRIDKREHNNRIDDEIIAGIRRSKFLVADFTGQRGGVYFEAGFALGFGLPVIWLCRKNELKKVHFDNRQYNFILWEDEKLEELNRALQNRIEATIGRGPLRT